MLVILFLAGAIIGFIVRAPFGPGNFVGAFLGSLIPNILLAPISALAAAVIYFELRRIKEGARGGGRSGAGGRPGGAQGYAQGPAQPFPQPSPQPGYPERPGSQPPPTAPYRQPPPGPPPPGG